MAEKAEREYKNALHLFPATASGWEVPVGTCSALENKGIDGVWEIIERYRTMMIDGNNYFQQKRKEQTYNYAKTFSLQQTLPIHPGLARQLIQHASQ